MRMMLISLILMCLLAQLASAGASPIDSGGCGTVYTCFVPEKCKTSTTVTTMAASKVIAIENPDDNMILDDCDAIIRLYRYDETLTYVSIESFQETVKKVELEQYADNRGVRGALLSLFSCEIDEAAGKIKGTFFDKVVMDEAISPGLLKCKFERKRAAPHAAQYLFNIYEDYLIITTYKKNAQNGNLEPSPTKESHLSSDVKVRCHPSNFEFVYPPDERTKIYKKVSTVHKPEKYECEDKALFKMEYKKDGSRSYNDVARIECYEHSSKFAIYNTSGGKVLMDDSFEIRCVAETKFFCKYSPKLKEGEQYPQVTENADGSKLECKSDKPYLVIVGEVERYIHNPEFKCVTLGNTPIWTVKTKSREEILTKTGPTVYCTDQMECLQPISESAVVEGTLDSDLLPKCFERGTLKTVDNKDVTKAWCDHSIGEFKYTAGGDEHAVKDDTKFICEYPPDDDDNVIAKDREHKEKILSGALYAGIGSTILGIVVIAVVVFLVGRRAKRYKLNYELKERENQELYYTPKELAAVREREAKENKQNQSQTSDKNKTTEKTESRVEEKFKETAAVTSNQYKFMAMLMPVNGYAGVSLGRKVEHSELPLCVHVQIKQSEKENDKSSALIQRIDTQPTRDFKNTGLVNLEKKRAGGVERHDE